MQLNRQAPRRQRISYLGVLAVQNLYSFNRRRLMSTNLINDPLCNSANVQFTLLSDSSSVAILPAGDYCGEPSADNSDFVPRGTNEELPPQNISPVLLEGSPSMAQAQKSKPRLGRGLNSLIPDMPVHREIPTPPINGQSSPATSGAGQPLEIPIDSIRPNPHQPRKTIKENGIAELSLSLKSSGIIQPIVVRKVEGGYELIAGERRWLAAKLAGWTTVPGMVRDVDSYTQAQMALVENIQREDLNPVERAYGYKTLMNQLGLTQAELSIRLGEERSAVGHYLRLLDLTPEVRDMVRDGRLLMGHAKILVGVSDPIVQKGLAELAVKQQLSVRNLERLLTQGPAAEPPKPNPSSAHLMDLEKSLASQLGMRVQVKASSQGRGRLILHYSSLDQFDELMEKLGAKTE
jgi:ParB family chromosome partitioning protein